MSHPTSLELFATICFGLAVLHTFSSKRVLHWCHRFPSDSMAARTLHFLAEPEVIFGLWAAVFFLGLAVLQRSIGEAVNYVESLNFIEPKFVLVVMVVAATKPVVKLSETVISLAARLLPFEANTAFYFAGLSLGPLLGSFITEPAAMTLLALVLKRRYFDRGITPDSIIAVNCRTIWSGVRPEGSYHSGDQFNAPSSNIRNADRLNSSRMSFCRLASTNSCA